MTARDQAPAAPNLPAPVPVTVQAIEADAHAPPADGARAGAGHDPVGLVLEHLREATGCDFRPYKRSMVMRRVERRMALNRVSGIARYAALVQARPDEAHRLLEDLLISVTAFFREPETFRILAERVVPDLVARQPVDGGIRVWVPGCATGEEAYSLAMLFHEAMSGRDGLSLQIFATDIDRRALAFARAGRYPCEMAADVAAPRRERFFQRQRDGSYLVRKALREAIVFAPQNLLADPPFPRLDLICCRNLMIYLDARIQPRLLGLFHAALVPEGYLVLGHAESVGRRRDLFEPVVDERRVYRRLDTGRREAALHPLLAGAPRPDRGPRTAPVHADSGALPAACNVSEQVRRLVMQEYAPACALISSRGDVLHLYGPIRRYLNLPEGPPSLNLFALVPEPVRHRLRAAVQESLQSRRTTRVTVATPLAPASPPAMRLTVRPLDGAAAGDARLLVVFQELLTQSTAWANPSADGASRGDGQGERPPAEQLECELQLVRDELRATIDQFESANEQLRGSNEHVLSMNEELRSTNEKLETSQEELQSLNEELQSVNSQLQDKIEQVEQAHDDITNFLGSTDIATVFLDTDVCIKRFTPSAGRLLGLDASDVGRPINRAMMRLTDESLLGEAAAVLDRLAPVEKEIRTRRGAWYTLRVLPYRTSENRIEGVVLTFSDVTRLRELVELGERRMAQQAIVVDLGQRALAGADLQTLMEEAAEAVARTLEVGHTQVLELLPGGKELLLRAGAGFAPGRVGHARVSAGLDSQAGYTLTVSSPVVVEDLRSELRFSGPPLLHEAKVVSGISVLIQGGQQPFGVLSAHSTQPRQFTQQDVHFLQSIANILAQVITRKAFESELKNVNRQLEQNVEQRTSWLRLMQRITATANEASSVGQAVRQILEQVCDAGGWAVGLAFEPAEGQSSDELRLLDCWPAGRSGEGDLLTQAIGQHRIRPGAGLIGRVFHTGRPGWCTQPADEPLMAALPHGPGEPPMRTAVALPVWTGNEVVGVLAFFTEQRVRPDDRLIEVMTQIGTQLGQVVGRARSARHLRESEYFINSVANTAPLLFAVVDLVDGRLVYANSQVQTVLGYSPKQLQAMGPTLGERLLHADDWAQFDHLLERLGNSPPGTAVDGEYRVRHADGSWGWFVVRAVGFTRAPDGTLRQVLVTLEDITERKQAEEALGESEQRFRAVFECADLGIGLVRPDGRFAAANPALEQMLGYEAGELYQCQAAELTHPDDRGSELNRSDRLLAGEEDHYDMQKRLLRKNGDPLWVQLSVSLIRDGKDEPLYALGIVQDITERKNLDEAMANLALREQQRIGQDLHDKLGQELTGLSFMAQSLRVQFKEQAHPEAGQLEEIAQGLRRALNDVRTVSRGLYPVDVEGHDVREALKELACTTEAQYGVTCRVHVEAEPPPLDSHGANHLFRIVQEAVRNAVKHADPRQIDLSLVRNAQDRFEVIVEDDGSGLPKHQEAIEGIGLRIMRHRASVIGADMSMDARPEGGSRVRCTFRRA